MRFKRYVATILCLAIMLSVFSALPFAVHAESVTETEKAIFIGKAGSDSTFKRNADAMLPLNFRSVGNVTFSGETYFKLTFKCKMISGSKPIIGVLQTGTGGTDLTYSKPEYCDLNTVNVSGGVCTAIFRGNITDSYKTSRSYTVSSSAGSSYSFTRKSGERWGYLTIGNAQFDNTSSIADYDNSFIFSEPVIQYCNASGTVLNSTNLCASLDDENVDFKGTYYFRKNTCEEWDCPAYATAGKWHILGGNDLVRHITVPADFNISSNYNKSEFSRVAETDTTREYYTNPHYSDLIFEKIKNSEDSAYRIISDINKKTVIVEANHQGEAESSSPVLNKSGNLFIPFSVDGYFISGGGYCVEESVFVKISCTAKRLEGTGAPVVGRIHGYGKSGNWKGLNSQAHVSSANNVTTNGYNSTNDIGLPACSYNAQTGEYVGWIRMRKNDSEYRTQYGITEILTLGNAEEAPEKNRVDSSSFNSSFAFSDIKVSIYECKEITVSGSPRNWTVGELFYDDVCPGFYEESLDTTTTYAYRAGLGYSASMSMHEKDVLTGDQNIWQVEGQTALVHSLNLTDCIANNHNLTHFAATDTTREYYSCKECGKNYKDPYGDEEVTDITAKKQMIYIPSTSGKKSACAVIPMSLKGFSGEKWFKFTCKMAVFGDEIPTVSNFRALYSGGTGAHPSVPEEDDMCVTEYSYNADEGVMTALIKMWAPSADQIYRMPYHYSDAVSGANFALLIGNGIHRGAGFAASAGNTAFAFCEPEFYQYNEQTGETFGDNLIADITDKNVDLVTKYSLEGFNSSTSDFITGKSPMSAPINRWYSIGSGYDLVEARDIDAGYFNIHIWQYHPAVAPTHNSIGYKAYYTCDCDTHSGKLYSDRGVTEVLLSDLQITGMGDKRMVVMNSTGNNANIFIPVDFKSAGDTSLIGARYYKLTFKAKLYGDNMPVVSLLKITSGGAVSEPFYVYNGGIGNGEIAGGGAAYGNNLGVSYDASSMTYTAYIRMITDAQSEGAHHAILIGNCEHNGSAIGEFDYHTAFAIADVGLYAYDSESGETYGESLINDFAEFSMSGGVYRHPNDNYNEADGIASAPVGLWSIDGDSSAFVITEVPENFFANDRDISCKVPKMLRVSGTTSTANINVLTSVSCLKPGKTYKIDVDYRAFGGGDARIAAAYYNTSNTAISLSAVSTDENVTGSHRSLRFTLPSAARTKGYQYNFALFLGMPSGSKNGQSVYFSDIKLCEVNNSVSGSNILPNGDFSLCDTGRLSSDTSGNILGFTKSGGISNCISADIMDLPEKNIFEGADVPVNDNIALKAIGGGYSQLQFKVELQASSEYLLTYDYRCSGDTVSLNVTGKGTAAISKISDHTDDKYTAAYRISTGSEKTPYSDTEPNTRFRFGFDANSADKAFYITNVKLFKLSGQSPSGNNLLGDLNPIYNSELYENAIPETLPSGKGKTDLVLNQSGETSMANVFAHGWYMYNNSNSYTATNASLVRVPDNFFDYLSFSKRLDLLGKTIIGENRSDGISPQFNPNNDNVWGDVKDLVHTKIEAIFVEGDGDGGAYSGAMRRISEIMSAGNTETAGSVYYVSSSTGSDSNDGKTENTPFKTPEKAMSASSSGDTILFRRSDEWRNTSESAGVVTNFISNRTYGAYGTGDKPRFLGGIRNYGGVSNASSWENTGGNVWRIRYVESPTDGNTAGMVYVFSKYNSEPVPCKNVAKDAGNNDYSYSLSDVDSDLKFYAPAHTDSDKGYLYLYSSVNPANRFDRIEICLKREVIYFDSDVKINNLAVMYAGGHGMNGNSKNRVYITDCEVGYIGGARHSGNRYGNGIQLGQLGDGFEVVNCYIHDCFDAGVTFQSWSGNGEFRNIKFNNNVIERCHYNIEMFATYTTSVINNVEISGNILRNAGYGWGSADRCDEYYRCANICFSKNKYYSNINMYITNNVLDCTKSSLVMWTWSSSPERSPGLIISGNTYIQRRGAVQDRVMAYGPIGGSFKYASSLKGLKEAVNTFDTNPSSVIWLDSIG